MILKTFQNLGVLSDNEILRSVVSDILSTVSSVYIRYEMSNSPELVDIRYTVIDIK